MRKHRLPPPYLAVLLTLAAVFTYGSAGLGKAQDDPLLDPIIVRIYYEEIGDLNRLQDIDLFEFNNFEEKYVLAAVREADLAALRDRGWTTVREKPAWATVAPRTYYNGYRTVNELYQEMAQRNAQQPTLTELVPYGQSYCYTQNGCETPGGEQTQGYDLLAMRVTNEAVPGSSVIGENAVERGLKPVFFLLANIHARELTTPEIAMRWMDLLLDQYGHDADITWLVDWHELWIIPTANPDGHWITELDTADGLPLLHRKNLDADADSDGTRDCPTWPSLSFSQVGVDLNRNHSFAWQAPGGAVSACSQTYSGPAAASEPEVSALQALISALFADRRGLALDDPADETTSGLLLTLHSYGDLVLRPWAFMGDAPPNEESLKAIGDTLALLNGYRSCRSPDCLYFAQGTTDDWAYGELGLPAFTFEIGGENQGFRPPYAVIDGQQWPDNAEAFLYAARIARAPYQLVHGPVASELAVAVDPAGTATAEVIIDDREHGGQILQNAEYVLDLPFWSPEAAPQQMIPVSENPGENMAFTAVLDITGFLPGRHTIFVRGTDVFSHTGPTSAAFFTVPETVSRTPYPYFLPIIAGQF